MRSIALHILILAIVLAGPAAASDEAATPAVTAAPVDGAFAASESLAGNGTRAGYFLAHGNVIQGSESVYIGSTPLTRDRDYTIDYASGTICFTGPVQSADSIKVDYRYSDRARVAADAAAGGSFPFRIGEHTQISLLFASRAADPKQPLGTPGTLTYGMSSDLGFGPAARISGLLYFSAPQYAGRVQSAPDPAMPARAASQTGRDRLILQNAELGTGKVRLKLGFQDVGEGFAGFASLRDSKAAPADVLRQLEKEKGIKRMDFAGEIASGSQGKFNFSMGKIEDKKDDIVSRAFGYTGGAFKLSVTSREVGKGFTKFADLREADRAQLAAEIGMKRTNYLLQFRTGLMADKQPIWSGLSVTQLKGPNGSLSYKSLDLDFANLKIQADVRDMDPKFNRMAALNDEERTRMALIARRQFNPKAAATEVTAADKAQMNKEAGLDRSTYIVHLDGQLSTWLSLSNVDSDNGDLRRRSINVSGSRFSLYYNRHTIDKGFARLSSLQPIEILHYGNEWGMTRSELGGTLKMAGGQAAFSHRSVTDYKGADLLRQSLDYTSPRLKFRFSKQDIDPSFTRILDLSDVDKALMAPDQGFRRSDYWINFQATRALNIDTYVFDSANTTAGQERAQKRYTINYAPSATRRLTYLSDDYSYISQAGNLSSYSHRRLAFDNKFDLLGGLTFRMLKDTNVQQTGSLDPVRTSIDQYRIESDPASKTAFVAESLQIDRGDGRFANTQAVEVKSKALKNVSVVASYVKSDTEKGDTTSSRFGFEWAIRKDLALKVDMNNGEVVPGTTRRTHQFSLSGLLAKRLLIFDNVRINSAVNETTLSGKQIGCDNGLRVEAGLLGGKLLFDNSDKQNPSTSIHYRSRILQYESDRDPKKWYHLTFFRQNLIDPLGHPAKKRNYALDMRLSPATSFTLSSYYGKDGPSGTVLPIGGTVFKVSHATKRGLTFYADYTSGLNEVTRRSARVVGLGFLGTLSNKAAVELYLGWCTLDEGPNSTNKSVFRVKYDHKIDADHFLTLTAERKSGVEIGSINPYEGDTLARIDFRTLFH